MSRACASGRRVDIDQDFRGANASETMQDFLGISLDARGNIWVVGGKRELHPDFAIVDIDGLDQTERHNVAAKTRISNRAQSIADLFL